MRHTDRGRRARPFLIAGAVLALGWAASSAFSVSCAPRTPCLELREVLSGAALPEAIHILDREGGPLADVAGPYRFALPEHEIPERVARAFVAVEDRRFWSHGGVDAHGVARALVRNVFAGGIEEGASTIPMQLVRTLWGEALREVGPWRRKVIETRTAPRLVRHLGREGVLALYLNSIYLGDGIHGVEAAARHWFGVGAAELDAAQLATLVGMARGPGVYDPRRFPERTRARRDVVLGVLEAEGVIPPEEAAQARATALRIAPESSRRERSHLTAAVTRELRAVAPELAGRPGIRVWTAVDREVQDAAEEAVAHALARVEAGAYGRFVRGEDPLEGAAVAVDPASGAVRAWVGGRDFRRSEYDRVNQARRQVGSLVKPFVVAAALESGWDLLGLVSTVRAARAGMDERGWVPADHVEEPVLPLREALVRSSNRAAVAVGTSLGVEPVRRVGRAAGITGPIPAVPSSFIGAFEASLLEMVSAYAVFGNGGLPVHPYLIERVTDASGALLWARAGTGASAPVMSASTSFVILDAMRDVVDRGTAWPARGAGYLGAAAGKTGTTNEAKDLWFVGLVPGMVGGVWVGFDRPRAVAAGASGGAVAAAAWGRWMQRVRPHAVDSGEDWSAPGTVARVYYDPVTGEAMAASCRPEPPARWVSAWVPAPEAAGAGCGGVFERIFKGFWRWLLPERPPRATIRIR